MPTNPNKLSNLYWAILFEERSQRPTPKCTFSTELKSSFPLFDFAEGWSCIRWCATNEATPPIFLLHNFQMWDCCRRWAYSFGIGEVLWKSRLSSHAHKLITWYRGGRGKLELQATLRRRAPRWRRRSRTWPPPPWWRRPPGGRAGGEAGLPAPYSCCRRQGRW